MRFVQGGKGAVPLQDAKRAEKANPAREARFCNATSKHQACLRDLILV